MQPQPEWSRPPAWPGGETPRLPLAGLQAPPRERWALAVALFVATFFTATTLGAVWTLYSRLDVMVDPREIALWLSPTVVASVWSRPEWLLLGLAYSLPMLLIFLCHELGHYLTCRRYGIASTPPFFLPFPFALGLLGAFIRIRSPFPDKRRLFDVAVAGPIAGFVALLPFLAYGIWRSPPVALASVPAGEAVMPGPNLAIWAMTRLVHGPLPEGTMLNLHPFVLAGWVGLLATSINLLPVGQLDGGHILYALVGERHRRIANVLWVVVALGGFFSIGWLVWAFVIRVIGIGHPPVVDHRLGLDTKRKVLATVALLILLVSFMPSPDRRVVVGPSAAAEAGASSRAR
jgi:membrane-associated protease RseP (regulator of RpoE activity)